MKLVAYCFKCKKFEDIVELYPFLKKVRFRCGEIREVGIIKVVGGWFWRFLFTWRGERR